MPVGKTTINFRTYIGYLELFGERVPLRKIKKQLREFKLSSAVNQLAQINTLLVLSLHNNEQLQKVQGLLLANFLDDEIFATLKTKFGPTKMDERPVFLPQQILTSLRFSLAKCSETGSLLADGKTEGGYALGRCCMMLSDHLLSKKQEKAIAEGTSTKKRKQLALQLAPTFELHNPTNLRRAIVRADVMFVELLDLFREPLQKKQSGFDLAKEFLNATGLSLPQYCDLVFLTFAYYDTKDPEELIKNQGLFALNPTSFIENGTLSGEEIQAFLSLDSIKLQGLPNALQKDTLGLPSLDFTVFRRWPLVEITPKALVCVSPSFLLEKLSTGLNWTIVNSFGHDRNKSQKALDGFGLLFELYVDRLMRQIYPQGSKLFFSFPRFSNGNEAFDGALCLGEHLVIFEYKGGFLTLEAKYSGKIRRFERDLDKKFGVKKGAGVFQLVRKIEKLFHKDSDRRERIPELDPFMSGITKITPVLVVQEPFFRFDFFNWMLNRRFTKLMKKGKVKAIEVAPLQVIDIDSLERLKANLVAGDFRLDQCLNARAHDDPEQLSSFGTFPWKKYFPPLGTRPDNESEERFAQILKRVGKTIFGREDSLIDEGS
jgi:hypothetical protein